MSLRVALAVSLLLTGSAAMAQTTSGSSSSSSSAAASSDSQTMQDLLKQGFEIKSAVPNGTSFVVFMQKNQSAYACEFVSLTNTRCGAIN